MNQLWYNFKAKAQDMRSFLRTKTGSRMGILGILNFIVLFFAPLLHGFVGTAIFGCVTGVFLILLWRKYDREHVIVPAVLLCIPMLLDMVIYRELSVIVGLLTAMIAMIAAALLPKIPFFDRTNDLINTLLTAGVICVVVVVLACLMLMLVQVAWWILCIIAFFVVVAIFMGVVFSTAAYTASDGRRQARRDRERSGRVSEARANADRANADRYRDYRPKQRDTKIYNLDEDDIKDE